MTSRSSLLVAGALLGASLYACGGSDAAVPGDDGGVAQPPGEDASVLDGGGADASVPGNVPTGGACAVDGDCTSGGCDYTKHCASARSCTQHNGGDTCGPTGTDDCCTTLPVPKPGAPYRLDKFNITAGRFRAFVEKTKGDVRGYVQAHRPAWFEASWDAWLPTKMDDGTVQTGLPHLYPAGTGQDGVYQQLGPIHYGAAEQGGNEGCLTSQVGNSRTFRLPDDVNATLFGDVQQYPQDVLDQKPQQCVTFFMVAAFCIWDGGRLPTLDELDYAWDKGEPANYTYPWGTTPAPGGWDKPYPYDPSGKGFGTPAPAGSDMTMANHRFNFWMPSNIACIGDDPQKCDYSLYIAPPGRFPKGNGPFGHSDQTGNVYNLALPMDGTPGTDPATRHVGLNRTGAFDQHAIPSKHPITGFRTWPSTNKYLAVGGRCARD
ncbi:MAG: Tryptophan synthase alpha chain [Labilithrix sp.]|nr:Tryptophan synthase alpha chain [Labilithrix sp.]